MENSCRTCSSPLECNDCFNRVDVFHRLPKGELHSWQKDGFCSPVCRLNYEPQTRTVLFCISCSDPYYLPEKGHDRTGEMGYCSYRCLAINLGVNDL